VDVAQTGALHDTSGAQWIGPAPSRARLTAVLLVGTMGMMICGVQPVLLGSLVLERRLSSAALGWATTAEFLTLALAIWFAGTFWKPTHLRSRIALAAALAIIADALVSGERGNIVLLNRALAGLPEGVLVWLTGCMVARSPLPARMAAIFLTLQNVSQFIFAAILPPTLMRRYGADGGFIALAFTAALALLVTPLIPRSFVELAASRAPSGPAVYSASTIVCLLSIFLISAFSIGLFAYLAPLGAQAHLSEEMIGYAVSVVLGASTLGSALAAAAARKIPHYAVFAVCLLVNTIVVVVLAVMPGAAVFLSAAALFGFSWLFFMPFQVPMAIEADPTRRIAVILPGAQLLGASAGPLLSSFFVTDTDARGALVVCWVCFLVAFAMTSVQHFRRRRRERLLPRTWT
jgi:hypothetical protein